MKENASISSGKSFGRALSNRPFLKLISLLLALFIWGYIISTTPSLTREKHLEGLDVSVSGAASLNNYGLALVTDVYAEYADSVEVIIEISQNEFHKTDLESVVVYADVSNIRRTGVHEVPLTAASNKGTVTSIYPSSVKVKVENLDSREVPVEVKITGTQKSNYWYSVNASSVNPQVITISGPASIVQQTDRITAQVDVTGFSTSFRRAALLTAIDAKGENINARLITRSSSTCSVNVDIYPTKEVELTADASQIKVAEGYEIAEITFQPPVVTIAGDQMLLDTMDSLPVEIPSSDKPLEKTTLKRVSISRLSDFKYLSARQTIMTVTLREKQEEKTFTDVKVEAHPLDPNFEAHFSKDTVSVKVKGPASKIAKLTAEDLYVYVDVFGLGAGSYDLPVMIGNQSSFVYDQITPEYIRVEISATRKNDVQIVTEDTNGAK